MTKDMVLTTDPLPGAPLPEMAGALSYEERILATRSFRREEFLEMFEGQVVFVAPGQDCDHLVVRRKEFDADPEFDHMIVTIPHDPEVAVPQDFDELNRRYPKDAELLTDMVYQIMRQYRDLGADVTMAVLNTSSYDWGGIKTDEGVKKKRLPQSVMAVHIKLLGYRLSALREREMAEKERELVERPLREQFDAIVAHAAWRESLAIPWKRFMNEYGPIETYEMDDGRLGVRSYRLEFLTGFYQRLNSILVDMAEVPLGMAEIYLAQGDSREARHLEGRPGVDATLRVSKPVAIENIRRWIARCRAGDIPLEMYGNLADDPKLVDLIIAYMEGYSAYLQQHIDDENVTVTWGPSYSVLFQFDPLRGCVLSVADAFIVGKGANPTSRIVPHESHRAFTAEEREAVIRGNKTIAARFQARYGGVVPGDFVEEDYFKYFEERNRVRTAPASV